MALANWHAGSDVADHSIIALERHGNGSRTPTPSTCQRQAPGCRTTCATPSTCQRQAPWVLHPPLKASSFSEDASFSLLPEKKPVTLSCSWECQE